LAGGANFPFGGDQGFHLKQTIYMAYWWLSPIGSPPVEILGRVLNEGSIREALSSPARLIESRAVIFLFALAVIARCYFWRRTAALILAVVALVAWGLFERAVYYRYPGAWYLLATPFIGPAHLAGNIEFAGRLATASAAAAWLFLLRPFLVGRWPDIQILPAVTLVLWQKDALYYFDSVYLEPWPVVFS
jgi:hypothetical protein